MAQRRPLSAVKYRYGLPIYPYIYRTRELCPVYTVLPLVYQIWPSRVQCIIRIDNKNVQVPTFRFTYIIRIRYSILYCDTLFRSHVSIVSFSCDDHICISKLTFMPLNVIRNTTISISNSNRIRIRATTWQIKIPVVYKQKYPAMRIKNQADVRVISYLQLNWIHTS